MFEFKKRPLFDPADSFNHALSRYRMEHGEPAGGVQRGIWESREWAKANPLKLVGLFLLIGAAGFLAQQIKET